MCQYVKYVHQIKVLVGYICVSLFWEYCIWSTVIVSAISLIYTSVVKAYVLYSPYNSSLSCGNIFLGLNTRLVCCNLRYVSIPVLMIVHKLRSLFIIPLHYQVQTLKNSQTLKSTSLSIFICLFSIQDVILLDTDRETRKAYFIV